MAKPPNFNLDLSSLRNTAANREELKKIIAQLEEIDALKRELGIAGQTDYHGVNVQEMKACLTAFEEQAATLSQAESGKAASPADGKEKIRELTEEVAYLKGQLEGLKQTAPAAPTDIETMISAVSDDMNELKRSLDSMKAAHLAERENRDAQLLQRLLRTLGDGEEEGAFTALHFAAVEYLRADTPDNLSALLKEVERLLDKAAEKAEDGKIRSSRALVAGVKRRLRPIMLTGSRAVAQLRRFPGKLLLSPDDLIRVESVFATFESLGRHFTEQDLTAVIREKIVVFGEETTLSSDHEVCALLSARAFSLDATDGEIEALKTELTAFPLSAVLRFDVENYQPREKESLLATPADSSAQTEIDALKAEIAALRQTASPEPTPAMEELRALKEEIASLRKQLAAEEVPAQATESGQTETAAQSETAAEQPTEPAPQAPQEEFIENDLTEQNGLLYFADEDDFITEVPDFGEPAWEEPAARPAPQADSAAVLSAQAEEKPAKKREQKPRKTVEVRPIARQKAPFKTKQVKITATSAISEELQKKMDEMDA